MNRHKVFVSLGVALLIIVIFTFNVLSKESWLFSDGISIHIVIDNQTNKQIGPFDISDHQGAIPLHIEPIEPMSVMDVYYTRPITWGENAIAMTDSNGKAYSIVPYFENEQRGRVDIRVECVTPDGLSGRKRDLVSWYFSFEWYSWETSVCD